VKVLQVGHVHSGQSLDGFDAVVLQQEVGHPGKSDVADVLHQVGPMVRV
jgi:hypothetical protein